MGLLFLLFAVIVSYAKGQVAEKDVVVNLSNNPGVVFRYANFPSAFGSQLFTPQEAYSCKVGEKGCTSAENVTFCVPESATCCRRTWCNAELETCCPDGLNGGCCPENMQCAIGGKGCCKRDQPCFGPFICYDHSNEVCKPGDTTVEPFQCCPVSAPWCLFDPENGYGCFVEQELLTYTKVITSALATTATVKVAMDPITVDSASKTVSPAGTGSGESTPTSNSNINPGGSTVTSESVSVSVETWRPSNGGGNSTVVKTTTTKNNSTEVPTPTDSIAGAIAATGSSRYEFFKQVGAAGVALVILG